MSATDYQTILEQYTHVAGVDEAGRGPLAGSVVSAAVILPPDHNLTDLNDSKKLTAKKRELLFPQIQEQALAFGIGMADAREIDQLNILHATMLSMQRAVSQLSLQPDYVLIDGNRCPTLPFPSLAVVKGDSKVAAISAASILAKVTRDRQLEELHQHKGYPTKAHFEALATYGPLEEHRRSFKPVARFYSHS